MKENYRGESRGEGGSHGGLGTPRTHRTRGKRAIYMSRSPINIAFLLRDIDLIPKHDFGPHTHNLVHRAVKALEHAVSVLYIELVGPFQHIPAARAGRLWLLSLLMPARPVHSRLCVVMSTAERVLDGSGHAVKPRMQHILSSATCRECQGRRIMSSAV